MPPIPRRKQPKAFSLSERLADYSQTAFKPRPELLLHNNTVKPLHQVTPREILGRAWWDDTRRAAYAATRWRCAACGVFKTDARGSPFLEGHECYDADYPAGRMTYRETAALCHYCHCYIHDGRMLSLRRKSELTPQFVQDVHAHGDAVLRAAGLRKREPPAGPIAPWGDWRLVLFGVEYPPKFPTFAAWKSHFEPEVA